MKNKFNIFFHVEFTTALKKREMQEYALRI